MAVAAYLDLANYYSIQDGTDFDSLVKPGTYRVSSVASAKTMVNIPITNPGKLIVDTINSGILIQYYISNVSGGITLFRIKNKDDFSEWGQVNTLKRVSPILEYDTEKDYPYGQGFCITDRYIYMCNILDNTHEVIYQYDRFTLERKKRMTFAGLIRHGNDFTWDSDSKVIYGAPGGGSKEIDVFDEEFNYKTNQVINLGSIISLSGIAYDPVTRLTAIYGGDSHMVYVIKMPYNPLNSFVGSFQHDGKENFQCLAFNDGVIYGIYSSGKIKIMTMNGDVIKNANIGKDVGECEGIEVRNNKVYYNAYNSKKKKVGLYYSDLRTVVRHSMIGG